MSSFSSATSWVRVRQPADGRLSFAFAARALLRSPPSIASHLRHRAELDGITPARVRKMIAEADTDGDGEVDFDEFIQVRA